MCNLLDRSSICPRGPSKVMTSASTVIRGVFNVRL